MTESIKQLFDLLSKPTHPDAVEWKVETVSPPRVQKGENFCRGLVVPYISAREVMARLDEVVGPDGWFDRYTPLVLVEKNYAVQCHLTVRGVTKEDVGEGDSLKAAFSDALKRAAVKFGVGRFLYGLPKVMGMPLEGSDKRAYLSHEGEAALRAAMARYLDTGRWDFNPWTWQPGVESPKAQTQIKQPQTRPQQQQARPQAQQSEMDTLKAALLELSKKGVKLPANWDAVRNPETLRRLLARFSNAA